MNEAHRNNRRSAPERAADWLRSQIGAGIWNNRAGLPSLDVLARQAGVSRQSMWKALSALSAEGLVSAGRGKRTVLGKSDAVKEDTWKRIQRQLATAIQSGEFPAGAQLPSVAKLQLRFHSCYRTVYRALDLLDKSGVITRSGSRYSVPSILSHAFSLEVLLFVEPLRETNEGQRGVVQWSEQQAQKMGLRLTRYEHPLDKPFNSVALRRHVSRESVTGFVIDYWGPSSDEYRRNFLSLIGMLYSTKKPISIMDHVGLLELPDPWRTSSRVQVIASATLRAGADVARYLLQTGHKRVAFLTVSPDQAWAQRRYEGLAQTFYESGYADAQITRHPTTPVQGVARLACAAAGVSRAELEILFAPALSPAGLEQLQRERDQIIEHLQMRQDEMTTIRRLVRSGIEFYRDSGEGELADFIKERVFELFGSQFHQRSQQPLFTQLIEDSSITAWVAVTDGIGFAALKFLRSHSIDLPRRLSLVAFDNRLESVAESLSSYDFDLQGRIYHALSFAMSRTDAKSKLNQTIEWPGLLIQRQSSGKARL